MAAAPNCGISSSLLAQILVQLAGSSGLPQRQVQLLVIKQGQEKKHSFLTDSSGRASFQLDTSGWSDEVSLRVSAPSVSPSQRSWNCFLQWLPWSGTSLGGCWVDSPLIPTSGSSQHNS